MKQIMKRAWEIAKNGVAQFGGKVREYFASSLALAWKEFKTMTKEIVLVGSEKQIKWAMDIRESFVKHIADFKTGVNEAIEHYRKLAIKKGQDTATFEGKETLLQTIVTDLESTLLSNEKASFYIDNHKIISGKIENHLKENYSYNQYLKFGVQVMRKNNR